MQLQLKSAIKLLFQRSLSSPDGLVSSLPEDASSRLHLAALGQVVQLEHKIMKKTEEEKSDEKISVHSAFNLCF